MKNLLKRICEHVEDPKNNHLFIFQCLRIAAIFVLSSVGVLVGIFKGSALIVGFFITIIYVTIAFLMIIGFCITVRMFRP